MPIAVVAALLKRNGLYCLSRRKSGTLLAHKWEFPGGKLEAGESPEAALERELREEMGVQTRTGAIVGAIRTATEGRDFLILFYESALVAGEPAALDSEEIRWASWAEISALDLAPADKRFVESVANDNSARQARLLDEMP